jgi:hypothetical protein
MSYDDYIVDEKVKAQREVLYAAKPATSKSKKVKA